MIYPLILVFVGSFIAILSIFFGGFLISRKEKAKRQVGNEIIKHERELTTQLDLLSSAEIKVNFANILLYIVQFTLPSFSNGNNIPVNWKPIVHNLVSAITDRYRAAKGNPPTEEIVETWMSLAERRFKYGDNSAWEQMNKILNELIPEWQTNYDKIGQNIDELKINKSKIEKDIDWIRYVSFALQIVGLIIVLMKDLFK